LANTDCKSPTGAEIIVAVLPAATIEFELTRFTKPTEYVPIPV